jgi:hypothetical protein
MNSVSTALTRAEAVDGAATGAGLVEELRDCQSGYKEVLTRERTSGSLTALAPAFLKDCLILPSAILPKETKADLRLPAGRQAAQSVRFGRQQLQTERKVGLVQRLLQVAGKKLVNAAEPDPCVCARLSHEREDQQHH